MTVKNKFGKRKIGSKTISRQIEKNFNARKPLPCVVCGLDFFDAIFVYWKRKDILKNMSVVYLNKKE